MKRKVLFTATVDSHIIHFHLPYLKYFKENGYEVHVATDSDEPIEFCDVKHKVSFTRNPLSFGNLKAVKELKNIIMSEKYELIHTHTPAGSVVTRLAAKKARGKFNTRVIYTAHGFHFFKGASFVNWMLFYPIEEHLAKYYTDDLITINKEDYNLAKKRFKTNVHYVPGVGIDPKKFVFKFTKKEKIELRESLGLKEDDYVMIFPAELNKNKNQLMLINVMNQLVKINDKFKLLLPGKDSYNGHYQELVKEMNLDSNIKFLGYRKDIPKLLRISDLALSTSYREGLPVNLIESNMCSLPIVATNCRGNRDLVENKEDGFIVEINDVDDMVNKIQTVKNSEFEIEPKKDYLLETILKKVVKIYNRGK